MATRRERLARVLEERGVRHALVYGAERSGSGVAWLTGWPVTREAAVVFTPGERDVLFVRYHNHVPQAARLAPTADVRSGGGSVVAVAAGLLRGRGGAVGVIGPLGYRDAELLRDRVGDLHDLSDAYTRLRLVKSPEELSWVRKGAELTDRGVEALAGGARDGMDDHGLVALIEAGYRPLGGQSEVRYLGLTPMRSPRLSVPEQWACGRVLRTGDVLMCEVAASWWGYPGQLLRTFSVGEPPTRLFRDLHDVAEGVFDALRRLLRPGVHASELVEAGAAIDAAGFTIRDDLVHGYVGGYLPPVLRTPSSALGPVPDVTLEEGMTLVVQPNVVTEDERAGVQTGELLVVGPQGGERLHSFPQGLAVIG